MMTNAMSQACYGVADIKGWAAEVLASAARFAYDKAEATPVKVAFSLLSDVQEMMALAEDRPEYLEEARQAVNRVKYLLMTPPLT